ncbi:MetQ/NlpA family ABC transporter substrate-binding protein [Rhodospirillum rubrum]|uniref:NLPA lipoprotein n=1 Tax=Rhodospirillum rubrum (strain ATCC 11170 / ATH 1.1.1 / DSM 467 / LMG 4362 / NCIMB 8255 / S1) TaxID=269796 RepID=Q2RWA0_RHORT|nr:MetQ/NlpA family ABC transporter substrate-binding protein [Rhodospirillum rubrum]ABC21595.1 NLPA lipoprotein [Rhodospirillum rubrum ATCC 11170]AEO47281.1 NLPA lipoprotein [Rhodospirillum rubrum F11]MBK5955793.1 methionine ABC transporter substrate-binding protein [Rhodospirillum rubrum]QXG81265.1 methionine ABC transporter substrate-binding protein [Rhodospirillum rubrum]HAP99100.1 methionine ABC transporter substrate-binding protein [Rhodospirillum rubrum]
MKPFFRGALVALALAAGGSAALAAEPLKVGVSTGPYAEILEYVADLYQKQGGGPVKVVEFADYTLPNAALAQGDIDFNNFQHKPYLDNQIKTRGYDLVPIEKSIVVPLGLYSKGLKSVADLKDGAQVAIPNDPANGSRALLLLQQAGLLTIDPKAGITATPAEVIANPKHLKIKEIDAAQLPRSLDDVDLAAVTLNYAVAGGLSPKQALVLEGADTPWGLWFVAQSAHKDDPRILKYIALYRSPEVKDFILKRFDGTIIPTW